MIKGLNKLVEIHKQSEKSEPIPMKIKINTAFVFMSHTIFSLDEFFAEKFLFARNEATRVEYAKPTPPRLTLLSLFPDRS